MDLNIWNYLLSALGIILAGGLTGGVGSYLFFREQKSKLRNEGAKIASDTEINDAIAEKQRLENAFTLVNEMRTELTATRGELLSLRNDFAQTRSELLTVRTENMTIKNENFELKQKNVIIEQENKDLRSKLEAIEEENTALRHRLSEMEEAIVRLTKGES